MIEPKWFKAQWVRASITTKLYYGVNPFDKILFEYIKILQKKKIIKNCLIGSDIDKICL